MSGLILRRFKRSKEERESSAARRGADKGENSERTNELSSKARKQVFNKAKKRRTAKRLKSGDDEARANSRNDANVASGT